MSEIIAGRYEILRVLGRGGHGAVYSANDLEKKREVALKRMFATSKTVKERFFREYDILKSFSHPNIVEVYELIETEKDLLISMELLEGEPLSSLVEKAGKGIEIESAILILRDVADALFYAHDAGIVHRDVKPSNVLVGKDVKVIDFGVAGLLDGSSDLTKQHESPGTLLFKSPEQHKGAPVDHRTDIYSFGALSYFVLLGTPLFSEDTEWSVMVRHVGTEVEPLRETRKEIPKWLDLMVRICLEKKPKHRYQSFDEIRGLFSSKTDKGGSVVSRLFGLRKV